GRATGRKHLVEKAAQRAQDGLALGDPAGIGPEVVDDLAEDLFELLPRLDVQRILQQLEELRARGQARERHEAAAVETEDVADRVAVRMGQGRRYEVPPLEA